MVLDFDVDFIDDLLDAWDEAPPIRRLVAAFVGYEPKRRGSRDFAGLLAMFPSGAIR